jgi:hypothetical protein
MDSEYISESRFWNEWEVIQKASGDLFEFEDVRDKPLNQVWTIIDPANGDDGNWYASPGFHIVNRLGYVMTKRPWTDGTCDAIYFHNDFDRMDEVDGEGPN